MLEYLLVTSPWPTILVWFLLFLSDYSLTLYGARLYESYGKEFVSIGGSYELTPIYQDAIDNQRRHSLRILLLLGASGVLIFAFWYVMVIVLHYSWAFLVLAGGLILRQVVVHVRHLQNIVLYRGARRPGALAGHIDYARWLVLRQSATELWGFAGIWLLAFLLTGSLFMAGGALGCALTAMQHSRWSRRAQRTGRRI
jgi:hypothetical protein